jgi:phosphoglycerol transferase
MTGLERSGRSPAMASQQPGSRPREAIQAFGYYATIAAVVILVLSIELKLPARNLTIPFVFQGDTLHHVLVVKAMIEQGWWWHIGRLSAPFSLDMISFPVGGNVDYALMWILTRFSDRPGLVLNVFWLGSVVMTSISAAWSFNRLGILPALSFVAAVLYGLIPQTFYSGTSHLMLVKYLLPPVLVLAVFLIVPEAWPSSRAVQATLFTATTLLGFNYVYSAFFAGFCLLIGAALGYLRLRDNRSLKRGALSLFLLCSAAFLNLAPTLHAWSSDEGTAALVRSGKSPIEADIHGLHLRHLLLPVKDHVLAPLSRLEQRYMRVGMPFDAGESPRERMGLFASIGFLLLLLVSLGVPVSKDPGAARMLQALSGLNLAAILLSVVGGFGSLWNIFVSPDIRSYARVGVVIAFYAIAGLSIWLSQMLKVKSRVSKLWFAFPFLLGVVLIGGILDQYAAPNIQAFYPQDVRKFESVQRLTAALESQLPRGASIYQLPYSSYPNTPQVASMPPNEHLVAYVLSRHLRWSWPALSSRAVRWNEAINKMRPSELAATLVYGGFSAIWLDRNGFVDHGKNIVDNLTEICGAPLANGVDGRYVIFQLAQLRNRLQGQSSQTEFRAEESRAIQQGQYHWGETLSPNELGTGSWLLSGWAVPGTGFRWTQGRVASIYFEVQPSLQPGERTLFVNMAPGLPYQRFPVTVRIDDVTLGDWDVVREGSYSLAIPARVLVGKSHFRLTLETPNVRSPNDFGATNDSRLIGIPVREILIR